MTRRYLAKGRRMVATAAKFWAARLVEWGLGAVKGEWSRRRRGDPLDDAPADGVQSSCVDNDINHL